MWGKKDDQPSPRNRDGDTPAEFLARQLEFEGCVCGKADSAHTVVEDPLGNWHTKCP